MAQFKNSYDSHSHSLELLSLIYGYDSFLDNLSSIADMGCGDGLDAEWWATVETQDEPPEPRNFKVYAVDQDINRIDPDILKFNKNIAAIQGNFEVRVVPVKVDLIWAHDSFQYAIDPIKCLTSWKDTLNTNGMLMLAIPQTTYLNKNALVVENTNQLHNYNVLNLMYMLALVGFDVNDAYFYRKENTPWLYAAVYATDRLPLPITTTWTELAELNLVNSSVRESINRYNYPKLNEVVVTWLDKSFYQLKS